MNRSAHARHLARRFVGSLSRRPPEAGDERWAVEHLVVGEQAVWWRMDVADRRHAVGVAREVDRALDGADRAAVAAALLHDCGKVEAGLGTAQRVLVTLWAGMRGRDTVATGRGRWAKYLRHDELGGLLLVRAGSDPLTSAWAAQHHLPPAQWTVERRVAEALKAADDD
jgi:hypothetical protein